MKNMRKSLSAGDLQRAEIACSAYVSAHLKHPQKIAGYLAYAGEMPVTKTLSYCRSKGSQTYVPMLNGETLMFAEIHEQTPMIKNRFDIEEPDVAKSEWLEPCDMDVVLVPLVAFEASCNRMGMGGGFYDKSFAMRRDSVSAPLLLGVAHAFQEVQSVYPEWWDVPLDKIITDESVFKKEDLSF